MVLPHRPAATLGEPGYGVRGATRYASWAWRPRSTTSWTGSRRQRLAWPTPGDQTQPEARERAYVIVSICEAVAEAVAALRKGNRISGASREINRLENLADRVQRQAVSRLFRVESNAIEVMKCRA